jgi:hypothetical protein
MKQSVVRFLIANIYIAAAFCARSGILSAICIVFAIVWLVAAFLAEDRRTQPRSQGA